MAGTTTNLGLKTWDLADDDFSRSELANNWAILDDHDHAPGRGKAITSESLANGAVTGPKILDGAVTAGKLGPESVGSTALANFAVTVGKLGPSSVITEKIQDGAVQTAKIGDGQVTGVKVANGTLTGAKLVDGTVGTQQLTDLSVTTVKLANNSVTTAKVVDQNITKEKMADCSVDARVLCDGAVEAQHLDPSIVPLGQVIDWWRPDTSIGLPGGGWEVADGQTIAEANHDWPVAGSVVLPDLRNRFILGAATSGTGAGVGTPPAIGQAGAAHTKDLEHVHAIPHTHVVNDHSHPIATDNHSHLFIDPIDQTLAHIHSRGAGVKLRADDPNTTWRQTLYLPGVNSAFAPNTTHDSGDVPLTTHSHNHSGATGGATPGTSGPSNANSATAGSATQDIRPAYVGLLKLIKVRHG